MIDPNNQNKVRLPKGMSEIQNLSIGIFFKLLQNPKTELLYDMLTTESYLVNKEDNIYIFIESGNIKIINSIYSYDVPIDRKIEGYLVRRFELQLNKRRIKFKDEVTSKTTHYLKQTYIKLKGKSQ